jgi:hypothetical protein
MPQYFPSTTAADGMRRHHSGLGRWESSTADHPPYRVNAAHGEWKIPNANPRERGSGPVTAWT